MTPQFLPGFGTEDIPSVITNLAEMSIDEQWQYFQDTVDVDSVEALNDEQLKKAVLENLEFISSMSVQEYTLYQKWLEIKLKYPTMEMYSFIDGKPALKNPTQAAEINKTKNNMWIADSNEDYLTVVPELILTNNNSEQSRIWNTLRVFAHTQRFNSNIGRNFNYLVVDKITKKYLGVICLSSDFLDLSIRDKYIGWDRERKTHQMIKHTTIGSSILPVQPFGYNYVGGKLLALLCLSDKVQNDWHNQYGNKLVGVTTTSLYGKTKTVPLSQYDRLKHWKKMGFTQGSVSYEPNRTTRTLIENWLKKYHTYKYFEWYFAKMATGPYKRDHRNRSFKFMYQQLNIPSDMHTSEHSRGVYFSELFTNTKEFLREEINESELIKSFDTSTEYLTDLWKTKYASKRINNLVKQNRVSDMSLFYDDLIYMDWNETRDKYLIEVGR